jgi:hypothetical protein
MTERAVSRRAGRAWGARDEKTKNARSEIPDLATPCLREEREGGGTLAFSSSHTLHTRITDLTKHLATPSASVSF